MVMECGAKDDIEDPFEKWAGRWRLSCLRKTYCKQVSQSFRMCVCVCVCVCVCCVCAGFSSISAWCKKMEGRR